MKGIFDVFGYLKREWLFLRAQYLSANGQPELALECYDKALQNFPSDPRLLLHKALVLFKQKSMADAIALACKAIEISPSNAVYHLFAGVMYFDSENLSLAANHFNACLDKAPYNLLAQCYKSLCELKQNQNIDSAYATLLKHVRYTNSDFKSRLLIFCESRLLDANASIRYLDEASIWQMIADGKKPGIVSRLVDTILYNTSRLTVWLSCFYAPIKRTAYLHYLAGEFLMQQGKPDKALQEFNHAYKTQADSDDVCNKLIELHFFYNDCTKVWNLLTRHDHYPDLMDFIEGKIEKYEFLKLNQSFVLIANMALLWYYTGQYQDAIYLFKLCLEFSDDYYFRYYLGLCYLAMGDQDKAFSAFKTSVEKLNPNITETRLQEMHRICTNGLNYDNISS